MFDTNGGIAELNLSKHGQCKPGACNLKGEIGFFSRYNSNVITTSVETYYTNNRDISLHISATDEALFNVTGDFTSSPLTGLYDNAPVFDYIETGITLRYENKWNYISDNYVTIATMNSEEAKKCKYTDYLKRVFVDTISPTVPTIHPDVLPDCQNTS